MTITREEFLQRRRQGIGGSDVAAIMGISPWRTPLDVYLDKTGETPDAPATMAMRIGTELEDLVARIYCEKNGVIVQRFNSLLVKDEILIGNVDRLVVPNGEKIASFKGEIRTHKLLECKTSSDFTVWEMPPLYYETQVQWYMGLDDHFELADLSAMFLLSKQHKDYTLERDNETIGNMQQYAKFWWRKYIVERVPPPATCEEDCKKLFKKSQPKTSVIITDAIAEQIAEYKAADAAEKEAKARKQAAKDVILPFFAENEAIVDAAGKVVATYKSAKDSEKVDFEAVAQALKASAGEEAFNAAVEANTTVTAGSRRFVTK